LLAPGRDRDRPTDPVEVEDHARNGLARMAELEGTTEERGDLCERDIRVPDEFANENMASRRLKPVILRDRHEHPGAGVLDARR
jgi:hypothetical protein